MKSMKQHHTCLPVCRSAAISACMMAEVDPVQQTCNCTSHLDCVQCRNVTSI